MSAHDTNICTPGTNRDIIPSAGFAKKPTGTDGKFSTMKRKSHRANFVSVHSSSQLWVAVVLWTQNIACVKDASQTAPGCHVTSHASILCLCIPGTSGQTKKERKYDVIYTIVRCWYMLPYASTLLVLQLTRCSYFYGAVFGIFPARMHGTITR